MPYRRFVAIVVLLFAGANAFIFSAQAPVDVLDPISIFNRAQDLHEQGDLAGAIVLYKRALEIEPVFAEAAYQSGIAHLALGQDIQAERYFRRALEIRPDWTLPSASLSSLLVQRGLTSEPEALLNKILEGDPNNSPALASMVDLRLRTRAPERILRELLGRIEILTSKANPTASIWSARAALELKLDKVSDAKHSVESSLAIDPKNKSALYQSAGIALNEGDTEKASDIINILRSLSPPTEQLIIIEALLMLAEGNSLQAAKLIGTLPIESVAVKEIKTRALGPIDLEKQLATDPEDPKVFGRLCILFRREDPRKAIDYCRRASEIEPSNINHEIGLGAALVQAKQFEGSVVVLRKVIRNAPENWTAHANLATALFQLKRFAEAKGEFIWLTSKRPEVAAAYFFLAVTYDQLDEYLDAMATYQQFLKVADHVQNRDDIERVNLRLPVLQRQINQGKGKKRNVRES
jgi:tetratricopeptide (TPR) repeat protein